MIQQTHCAFMIYFWNDGKNTNPVCCWNLLSLSWNIAFPWRMCSKCCQPSRFHTFAHQQTLPSVLCAIVKKHFINYLFLFTHFTRSEDVLHWNGSTLPHSIILFTQSLPSLQKQTLSLECLIHSTLSTSLPGNKACRSNCGKVCFTSSTLNYQNIAVILLIYQLISK